MKLTKNTTIGELLALRITARKELSTACEARYASDKDLLKVIFALPNISILPLREISQTILTETKRDLSPAYMTIMISRGGVPYNRKYGIDLLKICEDLEQLKLK